jgi:hypothetical protein
MQKQYEAPELTLIGQAEEVVLGFLGNGYDNDGQCPLDFEFEQD